LPPKKQHALNEEEELEFESKRGRRGQAIPKDWAPDKKERYKKWLKHRHYLIKKKVYLLVVSMGHQQPLTPLPGGNNDLERVP